MVESPRHPQSSTGGSMNFKKRRMLAALNQLRMAHAHVFVGYYSDSYAADFHAEETCKFLREAAWHLGYELTPLSVTTAEAATPSVHGGTSGDNPPQDTPTPQPAAEPEPEVLG